MVTKLVFFALLFAFVLSASLFSLDYQRGQIGILTSRVPPEVVDALVKVNGEIKNSFGKFKAYLLTVTSQVNIGELTLADYIFSGDKQREREKLAEERRIAAEILKEKAEVERLAKEKAEAERIAKEKAEAERIAKEKAEAERIAKEKEAVRKAEEELQKKLREEQFKKDIEAEVTQKQKEAEEKFEQAKKKLEDSGAQFVSNDEFEKLKSEEKNPGDSKAKSEL